MFTTPAPLVPELDVTDLAVSLDFYVGAVGFGLAYDRPEERFAYLDLSGAHLMLQEAAGPGRRFRHGELIRPFGRGVNLQIRVADVDLVYERVRAAGYQVLVPLEDRAYPVQSEPVLQRQFVVADPDGYLVRLCTVLDGRPVG